MVDWMLKINKFLPWVLVTIMAVLVRRTLHCHHRNDVCSKMGSDESHFSVFLSMGRVTGKCPQTPSS